ncbi:MAG TPA: methyl-accepting chemotaxis protein [Thermoanaerobaculia bacterium]
MEIEAVLGAGNGRQDRRDNALFGGLLLVGIVVAGFVLLALGRPSGGGSWPEVLFLVAGALGCLFYGARLFPFFRRLEQRLPRGQERWDQLEGDLRSAFAQLGAGDLVRASGHAKNLPGHLARVFDTASEALSELAQQIQDSSIEVASAADAVNQISSELASGSSEQAASVVEITAAMEELARTAAQIADSAARQASLAGKAETSGDAGSAAVQEAVTGVEEVQKRISAIASRADVLGTRSKEIYRVLDLITEIAQETHILSLNAAIEAVAAGADGRRFAVVAEEVRHLAQRSQESVESVRNLLDEFSGSIRATIVATEEGSTEAIRVLERSRAASSAIGELRRASGDTSRVARQISLATQQQNAASDEVEMTLREVSLVVQRMTGGLKELSGTADRLNSLGLTIQLLAQSFHLDSPRSLKHMVEDWVKQLAGLSGSGLDEALDALLAKVPFVDLAYCVDTRGTIQSLSQGRGLTGRRQLLDLPALREVDRTRRPWYRAVAREHRTALTPPYESIQSGESCFTVGAPRFDAAGNFLGVLGVDINVMGWTRI